MLVCNQLQCFRDDWVANAGNTRGRLVILLFRLGKIGCCFSGLIRLLFTPVRFLYVLIVQYLMCVDIPLDIEVGGGLRIFHGMGLVVHPGVVIGRNCILRHGVTIGERKTGSGEVPIIGDDVEFGCNSAALGPIYVGNGALIGAGAVVMQSVPPGGVMAGTAAKLIRVRRELI